MVARDCEVCGGWFTAGEVDRGGGVRSMHCYRCDASWDEDADDDDDDDDDLPF